MADYNVKINVKTSTGYDTLYPKSKSDIIDFDKSGSDLSATETESAIKEVNTKSNTNKTNIGTLSSLTTDSKSNLVNAINEIDEHTNTANSIANTNKTNIGTLTSLKTSVKTSIVNAINSLYDSIIGKTLKTLDEVKLATKQGYYVDALAIKNFVNLFEWNAYGYKTPNSIIVIGSTVLQTQGNSYFQLFKSSEIITMLKKVYPSFNEELVTSKISFYAYNGDTTAFPAHFYMPEYDSGSDSFRLYFYPERSGGSRITYRIEYLLDV